MNLEDGYLSLNPFIFSLSLISYVKHTITSLHVNNHIATPSITPTQNLPGACPLGWQRSIPFATQRQTPTGSGMSKKGKTPPDDGPERGCFWRGFSDSPKSGKNHIEVKTINHEIFYWPVIWLKRNSSTAVRYLFLTTTKNIPHPPVPSETWASS